MTKNNIISFIWLVLAFVNAYKGDTPVMMGCLIMGELIMQRDTKGK